MENPAPPRWFRIYMILYAIFNLFMAISVLLVTPFNLELSIPLAMLTAGIAILFRKWWGIIPIALLALYFSGLYMLDVLPECLRHGSFRAIAYYLSVLAVQWFTLLMFWKHMVRRRTIAA